MVPEIIQKIGDSIAEGEATDALNLVRNAIGEGYSPDLILEKGLIYGITSVATKFREQRVMVPEVLLSSRAMHAGLAELEPYLLLAAQGKKTRYKVVLGTVAGDLHDIGKDLVKTMVKTTGCRVIDLGVDVTVKEFANSIQKEKPNFLMMSSLLTTTMPVMKDVINELERRKIRNEIKVFVGGTPVTSNFATKIGAEYYFSDAIELRDFLQKHLNQMTK